MEQKTKFLSAVNLPDVMGMWWRVALLPLCHCCCCLLLLKSKLSKVGVEENLRNKAIGIVRERQRNQKGKVSDEIKERQRTYHRLQDFEKVKRLCGLRTTT